MILVIIKNVGLEMECVETVQVDVLKKMFGMAFVRKLVLIRTARGTEKIVDVFKVVEVKKQQKDGNSTLKKTNT